MEPGEVIVAEELTKNGFEVFFPTKDKGIDFLIAFRKLDTKRKPITIQIKESRQHESGVTWRQIDAGKLKRFRNRGDYCIFVCYNINMKKAAKFMDLISV